MLRGERGERLGVSRFVLGEGLQTVRPWEDWGPGEGVCVRVCERMSRFRGGCRFGGSRSSGRVS